MSLVDLVPFILIGAAAFAAGYFIGRFQALAERGALRERDVRSPLPGPEDRYTDEPAAPPRPRGAPPPASSGTGARTPPRRSSTPPPAIAGLMGRGSAEKPGSSQK
ncbi:hypothetical protein [Hyphomicrobium sp.]|uniref:hypothetical protein n=1 Tax=Hyphomicrobium sp. TaxID=82 RepID=UPI002B53EF21|nr:hypothetical protein [Hyphomicrobium sp.]HRN89503.1 hypothetical protein [Hyphomicrobium sp.]HRQ25931.1 hypothetical protein [Hyphomicrobium sp.]